MKKVLAIVGPTAVGKTALSKSIAKQFNGEIINGDSVQVYKELDIGSAKITKEEMGGIVHHLLDIKNPDEDFSVAEFQVMVREKINEISNKNKLPIIVGGTGLYLEAVLYDFNFEKEGRKQDFSKKYQDLTNEQLHQILVSIDKVEADKIHPNNRIRVARALEIHENNKRTKTDIISHQKKEPLYDFLIIGLNMERKVLYDRINLRVDLMLNQGLEEEVRNLYDKGIRVRAISYKEFYDYFENKQSLDETIELIKKNTRHYAKRQLTYFRNKLKVSWVMVDPNKPQETIAEINSEIVEWIK